MTDPIVPDPSRPTPSEPEAVAPAEPAAPAAPATPAAPAYPPAAPTAPAAPTYGAPGGAPKRGLSLASFIVGLVGTVLFITNWFAILLGIVAVVLGFIGRSREKGAPRWMWLVGIILGFVAIVLGAIILIVGLAAAAYIRTHPNDFSQ
jgi:hypothetical protein